MIIDQEGLIGCLTHYTLVISTVGGAFFIFLFLWAKGRLDMDEEPKMKMLDEDHHDE